MVEVNANGQANMQTAAKTIQALKQHGKIPKETFVMLTVKTHPVRLRELPEEMMNQNGWFRMKPITEIVVENNPESPASIEIQHKESTPLLYQSDKKAAQE